MRHRRCSTSISEMALTGNLRAVGRHHVAAMVCALLVATCALLASPVTATGRCRRAGDLERQGDHARGHHRHDRLGHRHRLRHPGRLRAHRRLRPHQHAQHRHGHQPHREPHRAESPTGPTTSRSAAGTPSGDLTTFADRTFTTPLGATTAGGPTDSSNSDNINATRVTTADGGKVVSHVGQRRRRRPVGGATQLPDGHLRRERIAPGALVASSATGTLVANSWNTVPITATLAPNTSYFLDLQHQRRQRSGQQPALHQRRHQRMAYGGPGVRHLAGDLRRLLGQAATFSMHAIFAGDVTPPTVALTAPADGASSAGVVTLTADADRRQRRRLGAVQGRRRCRRAAGHARRRTRPAGTPSACSTARARITAVATDTRRTEHHQHARRRCSVATRPRCASPRPLPGSTADRHLGDGALPQASVTGWPGDGKHVHLPLDGGATKMDFDTDGDQSYTFSGVPGGAHTRHRDRRGRQPRGAARQRRLGVLHHAPRPTPHHRPSR